MSRVALVTGAGTGIGRATALALARRGHAIALAGRTEFTLQAVADEIRAGGGEGRSAEVFVSDVSRTEQVDRLVARVIEKFGQVDVLVNNAGMAPAVPLAKMSVEQWEEVLRTNLSSAFYLTRAVWPHMERRHAAGGAGSVIINISSMAARDPFPGLGSYAVAKSGLNMLTLMTAREGHAVGIRAVAIAPGAVNTEMLRGLIGEDRVTADFAMQPEEIAAVVVEAVEGSLRLASGETLFLHRAPA
jgi:NAD(P)-dependent dehydrogenase (short-subunit alcohol dehydrogenase family)